MATDPFPSPLRRLLLWTLVASISAAPSFAIAVTGGFHPFAMLAGVACFIVLLTAVTCTQAFDRFQRRPFIRRTLYIGYGTRVVLSLLSAVPPFFGTFPDLFTGIFSIEVVSGLGIDEQSFTGTLLITLLQGTCLNVVVALFMLVVYAVLSRRRGPRPGHCLRCGYDLRATPQRCPECGEPGPGLAPALD